MSDYVCQPIGSIKKKERAHRVCASISKPTPMPFVSLIEVFGANLPRVDSVPTQHGSMEVGGRLELRAQVSLSTRRNGVPGNEHDAKSWAGSTTDRGKKPYPSCCRLRARPPANGNSLPHARGQRGDAPRASGDSGGGDGVSIFARRGQSISTFFGDCRRQRGRRGRRGRRQRDYQRSLCRNEMAF